MKIKLSRSQWELVGKKAGWMKQASESGMMPGQTPYTPEEQKQLHQMVSDAAQDDPGELNEAVALKEHDDNTSRRRTIKVTFSDGESLETSINGTVPEIRKYYLHPLNNVPTDYDMAHPEKTRTVTNVEFIR